LNVLAYVSSQHILTAAQNPQKPRDQSYATSSAGETDRPPPEESPALGRLPLAPMTESAGPNDNEPASGEPAQAPPPPKRSPGHRGQDVRDTVAELAARAHEISLEAGSKMSGALRDVIGAAAGLTAFAVESARDLVQYMVRRGQMTQEEADKLIREAEEASSKRGKAAKADSGRKPSPEPKSKAPAKAKAPAAAKKPAAPKKTAPAKKPAAKK
jgi:hypothetical protein